MNYQEEAFIEFTFKGDFRNIKLLVKNGVDFKVAENWAARIAAKNGHLEILSFLIESGVTHEELSIKNTLALACVNKQYEVVQYLITASNAYKNDSSAVQWTASNGDTKMISILLGYCINLNWIFVSAAKEGHLQFIKFLLDNEINTHDNEFKMTFNNAILARRFEIADYLYMNSYVSRDMIQDNLFDKYDIWKIDKK